METIKNVLMSIPHEVIIPTWCLVVLEVMIVLLFVLLEIRYFKLQKTKKKLADSEKALIGAMERKKQYVTLCNKYEKEINDLEIDRDTQEYLSKNYLGQLISVQKHLTRATDVNRKFAVNRAMELIKARGVSTTSEIFEHTYKMIYRFLAGKEKVSEAAEKTDGPSENNSKN